LFEKSSFPDGEIRSHQIMGAKQKTRNDVGGEKGKSGVAYKERRKRRGKASQRTGRKTLQASLGGRKKKVQEYEKRPVGEGRGEGGREVYREASLYTGRRKSELMYWIKGSAKISNQTTKNKKRGKKKGRKRELGRPAIKKKQGSRRSPKNKHFVDRGKKKKIKEREVKTGKNKTTRRQERKTSAPQKKRESVLAGAKPEGRARERR